MLVWGQWTQNEAKWGSNQAGDATSMLLDVIKPVKQVTFN